MDLDAFATAHAAEWDRLGRLARKRTLTGPEADELIEGYQLGAADLAALKTSVGSTAQGDRLSVLLSRARLRFTGADGNLLAVVPRFFALQLPAALYRLRWLTLAVAVFTIALAAAFAVWADADPRILTAFGSTAALKKLVDQEFVGYYSQSPAAAFAGQVWTNNAWIAAQCIAFGITGIYVPYVVAQNAVNIGVDASVMFAYHRGDVFFAYLLPHGMLELTSIFTAAAAGLRLFWAWVAPGPRTRSQALGEDGRALFTVAVGLVCSLLVSGLIEGFVTPSALPTWLKVAIGAVAVAAFLVYMLVVGRRAAQAGHTGDLDEFDRGAARVVAG